MSLAPARKKQKHALPDARERIAALLAWYDRHARVLPWRVDPRRARAGETPDPYRVWLSEIMLQQTTVKAVGPYFVTFIARWPDVTALAQADREDVLRAWAGLGYYSRARKLHECAGVVTREHGGIFPRHEEALIKLPGIGPYTASAIAAIAFDAQTMPLDGNIERVVSRLFAVDEVLPKAKPLLKELAMSLAPSQRAGDAAQALMDLGATICTPKKPACALCPLNEGCAAFARGDQETFPRKAPKVSGKLRRGAAFIVLRGDALLLRTRPDKGLLGGMTEVPGTEWRADFDETKATREAPKFSGVTMRWKKLPGTVRHVFTHFPLELVVYVGHVPRATRAPKGMRWVSLNAVAGEALPNVMRKVLVHGLVD